MNEDAFNLSMRKFLKQVGVTSQQQIEKAVWGAEGLPARLNVRTVVSIPELGMEHVVEGEIVTGGDAE